jgi:hypothetical protein
MDENRCKSDKIDKKGGYKSAGESAAFTMETRMFIGGLGKP